MRSFNQPPVKTRQQAAVAAARKALDQSGAVSREEEEAAAERRRLARVNESPREAMLRAFRGVPSRYGSRWRASRR